MLWAFVFILLFNLPSQAESILYSNDVLGELEPCGCRENPLGGMSRKFNFIRSQNTEFISVDSGDLLFNSETLPPLLHQQSRLQAEYVLKALDILKHQIIVPGEKDFALGLEVFEKLIKRSKAKFLAANLKKKSGRPFLSKNTIIKTKNGKRIGFFGLVGDKLQWPAELKVSHPITEARNQVEILKKNKCDIIVALTHQGLDADKLLAQKVPGISKIIGAHTQSFLQQPTQVDKTIIYQSSFRNQHIGLINLETHEHRLAELDGNLDSKPDQLNIIDGLVGEFKKNLALLNDEPANKSLKADSVEYHTYPKCAECHMKQFDFWRKTPHASSLHTLFEKDQARNKECLTCHSLALGVKGGYEHVSSIVDSEPKMTIEEYNEFFNKFKKEVTLEALAKLKKAWAPVQCENCHSPGNHHPLEGTYSKTVEKSVCLTCHSQERAPGWYVKSAPDFEKIEKKKTQIACPPGHMDENDLRN